MAARPVLTLDGAPWQEVSTAWLDAALHREILRLRARYELSADELRGLYVSDEQVERLLGGGHDHDLHALDEYCRDRVMALHEGTSPLGEVQREFRLSDAEVRAVVVCLAPENDLRYQAIYAYLNDDATRRLPTVDLCHRLGDGGDALLDPCSPLFAHGLVDVVRPAGTVWRAAGLVLRDALRTHLLGLDPRRPGIPAPGTALRPRVTLVVGDDGDATAHALARDGGRDLVRIPGDLLEAERGLTDALVRARLLGAVVHVPAPGPSDRARRAVLGTPTWLVLGEEWQVHLDAVPHEVVRPQRALPARAAHALRTLAHPVPLGYDWDDLVLPDATRTRLEELAGAIARRAEVFDGWGFRRLSGGHSSLRVLFTGGSGTGKTMSAAVVARAAGRELFQIDLSAVVSKYIGETEKHLEKVFRAAEGTTAILFFDEADALFGKRSEVGDAHDRYANIEAAYLLQRMERFDGVLVLATNLASHLDEAFSRRLHAEIEFPLPDLAARRALWGRAFPMDAPAADDIDPGWLAERFHLTGGEIRNVALGAALLAAHEDAPISMAHVVRALGRQRHRQGKLATAAEFGEHLHLVRER